MAGTEPDSQKEPVWVVKPLFDAVCSGKFLVGHLGGHLRFVDRPFGRGIFPRLHNSLLELDGKIKCHCLLNFVEGSDDVVKQALGVSRCIDGRNVKPMQLSLGRRIREFYEVSFLECVRISGQG